MNNTNNNNVKTIAEMVLDSARKSVLITNLSLAEALGNGIYVQYESFGEVPCVCIMGMRPDNTAMICCNDSDSNKIYLVRVRLSHDNGVMIHQSTQIYNNDDHVISDAVWATLLDDIELWSKGKLNEIILG